MPENQGSSGEGTLTLDSDLAELARLGEFLEAFCERAALPDPIPCHLSVALEIESPAEPVGQQGGAHADSHGDRPC